jgi:Cellulase (glycosyl hydrolase family 5)
MMTRPDRGYGPPPSRGRHARRRPWFSVLLAVLVGVTTSGFAVWHLLIRPAPRCSTTLAPLAAEQIARLQAFDSWLIRNHAAGYVGEVGWPGNGGDADQWNAVGQAWYQQADRDQLWVTTWSAAQGWTAKYPMAVYRLSANPTKASSAGPQATVVEKHANPGSALRGVDVPSGAFGTVHDSTGRYSDLRPGVYGSDYYYPTAGEYRYLAAHGVSVVRLAFMWERVQHTPFGKLDAAELHRIRQTVYDAKTAGLGVILDLHNFGAFWHASSADQYPTRWALGSSQLPTTALADLWGRLARNLKGVSGLTAYDLMNEPGSLAAQPEAGAAIWEQASQQAVTAIRATGDARVIAVEAYGPSGPEQFVKLHKHAWIDDPLGLTRYEMHQYFDGDGSGRYQQTLPVETRAAKALAEKNGTANHVPKNLVCLPA